ncbi:2-succinyl-5-enolpyruvyl-6-hydroxy-3-cyclohexene-1-carboxylic-acid synthase [Anaeromassilibacillus senegalensis]|uniref:2-succinyl-5-enolpyruvyl-6-hydroxy-3-cyclohexene-1-carboxylic-acid synthase n=1 Tax=Anaeromassilibacillus senegalensis TaxID=1673717 RepID=A0ABS9CPV9_9FIRM|nr:2-succinyl-5-enolpyruvyl-6-hydroxy-3-cyclohexene-1-carboxylic-acid synthase [Anaeromassilibacillus senegalensis]MCF2653182.1 2-succinyl-5-enolpyruvyl-6-hydroxy-3-cyclohexene-1-carboxylic-acid synthase [Anaeromassilibacillus senegalensis]
MYTKIKNVQILVSLLKQHNIRHLVLSAGTRHVPLAHSVENDEFFKCYSIVDERSAGYFALGLAKELGEPVAIACTSSTATCNYVPPIAEAYYQKVPLLVLTGDRDPYLLDQLEDQMINQVDMYKNFCKKCVSLPIVETEKDIWYCQRLINEAILELDHHGKGPVQINFPINQSIEDIADASVPELPMYNKIERCEVGKAQEKWLEKAAKLKKAKRILVVCGSAVPASESLKNSMDAFAERYNCVISTEYLSNVHCKNELNTYLVCEAITANVLKKMGPDVVIFFGGNFISRIKVMLRVIKDTCESWVINDDGAIVDPFQNLTNVFECSPEYFFDFFAEANPKGKNDRELHDEFVCLRDKINMPDVDKLAQRVNQLAIGDAKFKKLPPPEGKDLLSENYLSAFLAIYKLSKVIPNDSLLHLSILNSTRIMQMFDLDNSIAVYSNIGTDGIDGSMSTFLGQSIMHPDKQCFLVIGDLSFFYDMNSIGIRHIGSNVHILLVNNGGGAEFYFSMGPERLPNIDMHISAAHQNSAKNWVLSNNFRYLTAANADQFAEVLPKFISTDEDKPVVLEIFTNKADDIKVLKGFRRLIHQENLADKVKTNPVVQQIVQTEAGQSVKNIIKSGLKKFF